jgi:hypothetical protein
MTIKELLRAHRLASVSARKANTVKARETEFDLITVIARKLRQLRKQGPARDGDHPAVKADSKPSERA